MHLRAKDINGHENSGKNYLETKILFPATNSKNVTEFFQQSHSTDQLRDPSINLFTPKLKYTVLEQL